MLNVLEIALKKLRKKVLKERKLKHLTVVFGSGTKLNYECSFTRRMKKKTT